MADIKMDSEKATEGDVDAAKAPNKVTLSIDKVENFPDWFDRALEVSDFIDTRYPVKGMYIWKPYGYKTLNNVMNIMKELLDKSGHNEVYFPALVPESVFTKEHDFLKGFNGEAYIVTKAGKKDLTENLYIRPTSETGIYEVIRPWIRSASDLPLKIYQIVNVFRYETKQTRPMLRLREISKFKEAHTFHSDAGGADKQIKEGIAIYKEFFDRLLIPYVIVRTPSWDTFAGAIYNYDLMSVMPDGKAIELGSVINLGTKFAKAFGLTYRTSDNKEEYVHQTCYGISEREVGVLLGVHGDNNGIILPPIIAPIQIVVIPIHKKGIDGAVIKRANEIVEMLSAKNFRIKLDASDRGVGDKYYEWEAKGVPIRVEIGPKELDSDQAVLFRRDTKVRETVSTALIPEKVSALIDSITDSLRRRSKEYIKNRVFHFNTVDELKKVYIERQGMVGLPWCGDEKCGRKLEEVIEIPTIGYIDEKEFLKPCAACGKAEHVHEMLFGRTY